MNLSEHVFFREEPDHTGFLFHLDDCGSVILNRTGVFLLKQLLAGVPEDDLLAALQNACASPLPPSAQQEVRDFLDNIKNKGFLQ